MSLDNLAKWWLRIFCSACALIAISIYTLWWIFIRPLAVIVTIIVAIGAITGWSIERLAWKRAEIKEGK